MDNIHNLSRHVPVYYEVLNFLRMCSFFNMGNIHNHPKVYFRKFQAFYGCVLFNEQKIWDFQNVFLPTHAIFTYSPVIV
jgi:hypothetical protein